MILFKRLAVITLLFAFASTMALGQTKHRRTRRTVRRSTVTRRAPVASTTTAPRVPLRSSSFLLANGTPVVGVINQALSTQTSRSGDTFTMRVTQPSEYRGAVVNGHLSGVKRSGKLTGRSEMTLNFDRIRLPNGDSYRFAGTLESMRLANGETVKVDNEGTVQEKSQTSNTEKRAAIGGGAGLLIGAIAGGGKGAAIGTILGAGVGAGSVYAQGRKDLQIGVGTELTVRASAPDSVEQPR